MKCEDIRNRLPEALTGEMESTERASFDAHIADCGACGIELRRLSETWTRLGVLPTARPSAALSDRFYALLEAEKARTAEAPVISGLARRWKSLFESVRLPRLAFHFGLGFTLLVAGIGGGFLLGTRGQANGRIADLSREVQDMRQSMALTLLGQSSSSERLRGVGYSERVGDPAPQTIEALLRTLDSDSSVNVRLAAADALYLFAKNPAVKDGIVRSLPGQESPIVQVALIDLLVDIRERRAVDSLRVLVGKSTLDPAVRKQAENGIRQLTL